MSTEAEFRSRLHNTKNIVIKVGTRVLSSKGKVDRQQIATLVQQISQLKNEGRNVSLVSSGAIGTAMNLLEKPRPIGLGELQAFAAIGQAELIHNYNREFAKFGKVAAQVLLTADDVNHRKRYLNLRSTFFSLFEIGAIPIINENDCVATDEIAVTFGDNDRLAASVAMLVDADLLIILSDVDGLYDRFPDHPQARQVSFVPAVNDSVIQLSDDAQTVSSGLSRGGMTSKINAASLATTAGVPTVIARAATSRSFKESLPVKLPAPVFYPQPNRSARGRNG